MQQGGWERLVELAAREREVVADERWGDLAEIQSERGVLIASLPSPPPLEAAASLRAAAAQSRATERRLREALEHTASLIAALRRGRRATSAYGTAARPQVETRA